MNEELKLFHVMWSVGFLTGRFFLDQAEAETFAEAKAQEMGSETTVTPVTISLTPENMLALFNEEGDDVAEWDYENEVTFIPLETEEE